WWRRRRSAPAQPATPRLRPRYLVLGSAGRPCQPVHRLHSRRRTPAAPVAVLLARLCGSAPAAELELPPSAGLRTGYVRQRLRAWPVGAGGRCAGRSEEDTSELQSRENVVCRLLLEKEEE